MQKVQPRPADKVPWLYAPHAQIIRTKDHSLMRCFAIRGQDIEAWSEDEILVYYERLNDCLKSQRLGSGWGIWAELQHVPAVPYPEREFSHPVPSLIDAERRASFDAGQEKHFESYIYLTLLWKPPRVQVHKLESLLFEGVETAQARVFQDQLYAQFLAATDHVAYGLSRIVAELTPLDTQQAGEYLKTTASLRRHPVRLPEIPAYLDLLFADQSYHFGVQVGLGDDVTDPQRPKPEWYMQLLSIRDFPSESEPAMFAALDDHCRFPFRLSVRWLPMDKDEALRHLREYEKRWRMAEVPLIGRLIEYITGSYDKRNVSELATMQAQSAHEARTSVEVDDVSYGFFTLTIAVWDRDARVAADRIATVDGMLTGMGFTCYRETLNAADAFLGMMPGNTTDNVRRPPLASRHVARMMPFTAPWCGPEKDPHSGDAPLMVCRTRGNQPLRVSLHTSGLKLGHVLVVGPSGSGKTVLLNMMAMQFTGYGKGFARRKRVAILDKSHGAKVATYAVGGSYYICRAQDDKSIAFQPLGRLDISEHERTWCAEWVQRVMEIQRHGDLTPTEKLEIWRALGVLATKPGYMRTMTGLSTMLQDRAMKDLLRPYTIEGTYGNLFDAEKDDLHMGRWMAFEMGDLLDSPAAGEPAVQYLFHRITGGFEGEPGILIADEGYRLLNDPRMSQELQAGFKEWRKENWSIVFAVQDLADFLSHPIAQTLINNCPTKIYLPNASARTPDSREYYRQMGLSDTQIRQIAMATPRQDFYLVSEDGNQMGALDLGEIQQAVLTASWKEDLRMADELREEANEPFGAAWLRYKGLDWAANHVSDVTESSLGGLE